MPLFIYDLTDLLKPTTDGKYWYVKRKHQGDWYYVKQFNDEHTSVVWTKNKDHAIPYAFEKSAKRVAKSLEEHCQTLELVEETLE